MQKLNLHLEDLSLLIDSKLKIFDVYSLMGASPFQLQSPPNSTQRIQPFLELCSRFCFSIGASLKTEIQYKTVHDNLQHILLES